VESPSDSHAVVESQDRGKLKGNRDAPNGTVVSGQHFDFALDEQNDGSLP